MPYQDRPLRFEYLLTPQGADLLPILQEMARWAVKHIEGVWTPSAEFYRWTPEQFVE